MWDIRAKREPLLPLNFLLPLRCHPEHSEGSASSFDPTNRAKRGPPLTLL
jgi:hypothetical protein